MDNRGRLVFCSVNVTLCVIVVISASCGVVQGANTAALTKPRSAEILARTPGLHVEHSKEFPSNGFLRISPVNPLRDQRNLSSRARLKSPRHRKAILGTKRAITVTKMDYLKKEWCKTEPVKQTIKKQGCVTKTIINRFCYGQCNSFFIPRRRAKDIEENAFTSCAFCRPKRTDFVRVTLNCPGRDIKRVRKKIQVIKSCSCMALSLK